MKLFEINYLVNIFLLGLKSHLQHELFKKQTCGHSGVFSFYLKASPQETEDFAKNLKCFKIAQSLGGVDSFIMIPYV